MSLWLHVHGGYPSYAQLGLDWNEWDWVAYKFVRALKGHAVNGYATLQRPNGKWLKIEGENTAAAFQIFGEWGCAKLNERGLQSGYLVPVPSSSCLHIGADEKGKKLAQAIADRDGNFQVLEALHWHEQLPKAAAGGPRDYDTLLKNLRILNGLPQEVMILIDDVATTGGHLRACAAGLRLWGATVEHALCAAQTVNHRPASMFTIASRNLEG